MDQTDAFFTQTVVGAPFTALLGRRRIPGTTCPEGLELQLATGDHRLSRLWQEWVVLSHACDPVGLPRLRPGRLRGWFERHALWLAVMGIVALLSAALAWGVLLWT